MSTTLLPVAGSQWPIAVNLGTTDSGLDLTTASAPVLIVHRYVGETEVDYAGVATTTPETWTCTITGTPTANAMTIEYAPTASGAGSLVAGQTLLCRVHLTFAGVVRKFASQFQLGPVQVD